MRLYHSITFVGGVFRASQRKITDIAMMREVGIHMRVTESPLQIIRFGPIKQNCL